MYDKKREYIRVSAACPILYRVLDDKNDSVDSSELENRGLHPISLIETPKVVSNIDAANDHRDGEMLELLLWIDWKVNYLIKAQSREREKNSSPTKGL
jgi:hypothetical protein